MNPRLILVPCLMLAGSVQTILASEQAQDLSKRLAIRGPEIERLISEMKYQEALEEAEALIPTTLEPYNGSGSAAAFASAITYYNYAQTHFLAFKAADAFGQWEKALVYAKKAQELAQTNRLETDKSLSEPMRAWEELRDKGKKVIDANSTRIAELKSKQNPTNAELNELDEYISAEKNFQVGQESAKTLLFAWDRGTKYAKSYDAYVDYIQQKIEEQEKEIASYAPTKGDRAKWAEAISQAPSYLNTFTETKEKVAFIHRLMVLAPGSPKVKRALDIALGKSVAPEPKSKATQKK